MNISVKHSSLVNENVFENEKKSFIGLKSCTTLTFESYESAETIRFKEMSCFSPNVMP